MDLRSCLWWVVLAILIEVRILIHFEIGRFLGSGSCTKGRENMLGTSTHALIQYSVLYCGSNVLTASSPCTLIPPQKGLLPGMVSQLSPLFFIQKVAFCRGFITATGKTCETGKVNCFLAVCVNTTKHCSLFQRVGSGYQKPSWVKNEIKWKARKMRSKHC